MLPKCYQTCHEMAGIGHISGFSRQSNTKGKPLLTLLLTGAYCGGPSGT